VQRDRSRAHCRGEGYCDEVASDATFGRVILTLNADI
jgi:hypothetical protein